MTDIVAVNYVQHVRSFRKNAVNAMHFEIEACDSD